MPNRATRRAKGKAGSATSTADGSQPVAGLERSGRRGFAAMLFAQKGGCECEACRLLRVEMETLMDAIMGELGDGDDGSDS